MEFGKRVAEQGVKDRSIEIRKRKRDIGNRWNINTLKQPGTRGTPTSGVLVGGPKHGFRFDVPRRERGKERRKRANKSVQRRRGTIDDDDDEPQRRSSVLLSAVSGAPARLVTHNPPTRPAAVGSEFRFSPPYRIISLLFRSRGPANAI